MPSRKTDATQSIVMTRRAKAAAAIVPVHAVLDTVELLEHIMLQLPPQEVLLQQRVSKQWQSVFIQSHNLQKKVFLMAKGDPIKPSRAYPGLDTPYTDTVKLNSMARMQPCKSMYCSNEKSFARFNVCYDGLWPPRIGNPFKIHVPHISISVAVMPFYSGKYSQYTTPEGSLNSTARWRRMFVTQPPVTAIHLGSEGIVERSGLRIPFYGYNAVCTVWNPAGITFGELYDVLWKLHREADIENVDTRLVEMKICMPFPLTDEALNLAIHECTDKEYLASRR